MQAWVGYARDVFCVSPSVHPLVLLSHKQSLPLKICRFPFCMAAHSTMQHGVAYVTK